MPKEVKPGTRGAQCPDSSYTHIWNGCEFPGVVLRFKHVQIGLDRHSIRLYVFGKRIVNWNRKENYEQQPIR